MICIDKSHTATIQNNPKLECDVGLIPTTSILGEGSPYLILEESYLYDDPFIAEHLDEDLDIPLVDIHFNATIH